jgi:hypothetical protein
MMRENERAQSEKGVSTNMRASLRTSLKGSVSFKASTVEKPKHVSMASMAFSEERP